MWLATAKVQILVNGVNGRYLVCKRENGRYLVCKRELRQGNPPSLLLFILVADGLNMMLSNTRKEGMIKGLPRSSNLEFVNL